MNDYENYVQSWDTSSGSIMAAESTPSPDDDFWYKPAGSRSTAGVDITPDVSMHVSTVFACVRLLSEVIGSLPCIVYERSPNKKTRAENHPLYELLHDQPNEWQTAQEFFEMATAHVNLRGNFYARIWAGPRGAVDSIVPLNPDRMQVTMGPHGIQYKYTSSEGRPEYYTSQDIYHVRGLCFDGLVGISVIEYAKNTVGLAVAQSEHGATVFTNGSVPPFYIKRPMERKWTETALTNFRQGWRSMHGGKENANNPPILEDGMTLESLNITNKDSQWLESQAFQAVDVCRFFRVQPHMVGILDRATFSNIEHQGQDFLRYTIAPWLLRFTSAARRDLFTVPKKYFAEFLTDAILRSDTKSRYEAYSIGVNGGWLTRNEVRTRENLNPIEGGDELLEPLNMAPAGSRSEGTPVDEPEPVEEPAAKVDQIMAVDLEPLIADAAHRIAAKEIRILEERADKADEDPEKWTEWFEKQTGDHMTYIEKVLVPLLISSVDTQTAVDQIRTGFAVGVNQSSSMQNMIDEWKQNREQKLTEILKGYFQNENDTDS